VSTTRRISAAAPSAPSAPAPATAAPATAAPATAAAARADGADVDAITLFCDGSCLGNPGPGGWASLLVARRHGAAHERLLTGAERATTNNRMELMAAVAGLAALKRPCRVEVVTDSNYVVQGMKSWIHGWKKRGWKNSQNKPVENQDLWLALDDAARPHTVTWTWVKGHAGHVENERVDEAARAEALRISGRR
jgi:ribonuclease HI